MQAQHAAIGGAGDFLRGWCLEGEGAANHRLGILPLLERVDTGSKVQLMYSLLACDF